MPWLAVGWALLRRYWPYALAVAGLGLLLMAVLRWHSQREAVRAAQGKAEAVLSASAPEVARGASETLDRVIERDRIIERRTHDIIREVQAAPGAGDPLAPAVVAAARAGLCATETYRDDPQCAKLRGVRASQP